MSDTPPGYVVLDAQFVKDSCLKKITALREEADNDIENSKKRHKDDYEEYLKKNWFERKVLYSYKEEWVQMYINADTKWTERWYSNSIVNYTELIAAADMVLSGQGSSLMVNVSVAANFN